MGRALALYEHIVYAKSFCLTRELYGKLYEANNPWVVGN
jgi:hypothetical protein